MNNEQLKGILDRARTDRAERTAYDLYRTGQITGYQLQWADKYLFRRHIQERQAAPGETVSQATMKPTDLMYNYVRFIKCNRERELFFERHASEDLKKYYGLSIEETKDEYYYHREEFLNRLDDMEYKILPEFSPDGYFFGSHEGDGALFGYWKDE